MVKYWVYKLKSVSIVSIDFMKKFNLNEGKNKPKFHAHDVKYKTRGFDLEIKMRI